MSGMSTLHVPTLAFLFALVLVGYTVWDLDQLSGLGRGLAAAVARAASPALVGAPAGHLVTGAAGEPGAGGGLAADSPAGPGGTGHNRTASGGRSELITVLDSPGTVVGCRIAMGVTMALMLILML